MNTTFDHIYTQRSGIWPMHFLLVEDSEPDIVLTQAIFEEENMLERLHVVRDGVEALDFLNNEPPFCLSPRPDMILLDLHMPRMDGIEFLEILKTDPRHMTIPVAVLTTSSCEEDMLRCHEIHAVSYMIKPMNFQVFQDTIQDINRLLHALHDMGNHPRQF